MPKSREECLAALRATPHAIEPDQKFVEDEFRPGDGLGVARLYHAVYGEMFPVDHVYDPEELVRLNAGPDLHQVVGRTDKGDIVGLYALFRNPPGHRIMEGGSWIVHPAYRTSSLAMRLAARIHTAPLERLGVDVIFEQNVCDHVTTQKMGIKYNMRVETVSCLRALEHLGLQPFTLGPRGGPGHGQRYLGDDRDARLPVTRCIMDVLAENSLSDHGNLFASGCRNRSPALFPASCAMERVEPRGSAGSRRSGTGCFP